MVNHCISHVKDADGLCSAALTLAAKGGSFSLANYDQLIVELDAIPEGDDRARALRPRHRPLSLSGLQGQGRRAHQEADDSFIDHHYLSEEMKKELVEDSGSAWSARIRRVLEHAHLLDLQGAPPHRLEVPRALRRGHGLHGLVPPRWKDDGEVRPPVRAPREHTPLVLDLEQRQAPRVPRGPRTGSVEDGGPPHDQGSQRSRAQAGRDGLGSSRGEVGSKGHVLGKLAYMETEQSSTGNLQKTLSRRDSSSQGWGASPTGRSRTGGSR